MSKRFWGNILLVIPLLLVILIAKFTEYHIVREKEAIYDNEYANKVRSVQRIGENVESLIIKGYDLEHYEEFLLDVIKGHVQILDEEYGVFAVVVDTNLNILSKRFSDDLVEPDPIDVPLYRNIMNDAIESHEQYGERTELWKKMKHTMYFRAIPLTDPIVYVFIGIGRDRVYDQINLRVVEFYMFLIGIILLVAIWYIVYLKTRTRTQRTRKDDIA